MGGLGNQMFQYAFGYAVARENDCKLRLDISSFNASEKRKYKLDLFKIKENSKYKFKYFNFLSMGNSKNNFFFNKFISKFIRLLLRFSRFYYNEKEEFSFDKNVFNIEENTYFYGYWQNEKYFKKYRNDILKIFKQQEIHKKTKEYRQKIISVDSVSIHIRRGDYVTDSYINSIHGTCEVDYYKKAVSKIKKDYKNSHFFIFSDDISWAKKNFDFIDKKIFIEPNDEISDHEAIYLMSQCSHNIIANSSFSWWGAWLNQNPNKRIIAPKRWFKNSKLNTNDLIPESWLRL